MAGNDNLNEQVEVAVDDASVVTVPIDATLSNSNEAADAKAVGDALALKADKSELQTAVTVNGQSADNQGHIIVTAADTKMSSTDNTTVKAKIESVDAKTAADINVSSDPSAQTIAQALANGATRTADQIAMSSSDNTTVKAAIETVAGDLDTLEETVAGLDSKTAANIKYQTGSNETIKEHVDALDSGIVKSVYGETPDANGDVSPDRVPYADNLFTDEMEEVDDSFLIRTAGGSLGISSEDAWLIRLKGNSVHTGYTAESIAMTVNAMVRPTPAAITAVLDKSTFEAKVGESGTYTFTYTTEWSATLSEYGITVSNTPISGDEISVVWDGENDPVMTVSAVPRTAPAAITATIDRDTWVGKVLESGTYAFTYSTVWKLSNVEVNIAEYGITITNTPVAGDEISVVYVKEIRGTITHAALTGLKSTGWNLYDHTNGYARVVKYSNLYGYAISGTYTSLAFATTPDGEGTTITPDADGLFDVSGDGYIIVTGGNSTNTAIWPTWSDWDEGYTGSFEAYKENTVDLSEIVSAAFPYGLCKVGTGDSAVCDEIDFNTKQSINRILRMTYSDENKAAAEATGRAYEYDENYIYLERSSPLVSSIEISENYKCDDHGLEWFTGTTIPVYSEILYGQNLKDKLRRDVVTIREQTFTNTQKSQARTNIGAASAADVTANSQAIANIATVVTGTTNNSGHSISAGEYFIANGAKYKASSAIGTGVTWSDKATSVSDHDLINALNSNVATYRNTDGKLTNLSTSLNDAKTSGRYYATWQCTNTPTPNIPGYVDVYAASDIYLKQTFYDAYSDKVYTRRCENGTWSAWEQLALNSNITDKGTYTVYLSPGKKTNSVLTRFYYNWKVKGSSYNVSINSVVTSFGDTLSALLFTVSSQSDFLQIYSSDSGVHDVECQIAFNITVS